MKIKYMVLGILLTMIVAISIHIITIEKISNEIIHVKEIPLITKKFTSLNEEITKVEDDTCKMSLNHMLDRIKSTYFSDNITVKEYVNKYFQDDKKFVDFYEEVNNSCKLDNNDDIYFLVLSSQNYPNSIKNRYDLRYEFTIRDTFSREDIYRSSDEVGTYTTKLLEIKVINALLEEVLS